VLMMSGDDVLMMPSVPRIEVFTGRGRRRRWSAEDKARILEESYLTSVGEVASRYDVSKTQIFTWRRVAEAEGFAHVVVDGDGEGGPGHPPVIEISVGGACVRVPLGADPRMVTAIMTALKGDR
jgi:transposase